MPRLKRTLLAAAALAYPALAASRQLTVRTHAPAAKQASSADVMTSNVLSLRKSEGKAAKSAGYLGALRSGVAAWASSSSSSSNISFGAVHVDNVQSKEYAAEVEWNGVPVKVIICRALDNTRHIINTGSSDTWLVQAGFTCVDEDKNLQTEANCSFGPVFNGTFGQGSIEDQVFDLEYGDGRFLKGDLGYESVTVAGITVDHQQVALVDYAYWFGDSETSGFMGMAYAYLTSAYEGTSDTDPDLLTTQVQYDPIITSMIKQDLIEPVFSLAFERDSDSGYLALGGLPPVKYTGSFATTPILMLDIFDDPAMDTQYSFYTIIADAYIYKGSEERTEVNTECWSNLFSNVTVNTTQFPVIVDSGTLLLYLPTELYEDIIALYDPPAIYIDDEGAMFAPCNASVPSLGIQINGTVFYISEADMLMQSYMDSDTGYCLTGPQDGGTGPYILGDTFMNNVISVFDIGASEMRFAAHYY